MSKEQEPNSFTRLSKGYTKERRARECVELELNRSKIMLAKSSDHKKLERLFKDH